MGKVTRWWWIRHAPVTSDNGRIYGQRDLPADVSEVEPFRYLAAALPKNAMWVTSHLQRTHQTAAAVAEQGVEIGAPEVERDFAEQHFGEWQGQNRNEIFAKYGADHGFWLAPAEHAPPGGESFADLKARVVKGIVRLNAAHTGRDIVAVAHGGTIRAAVGHALGLEPAACLGFVIGNCSLTRLDLVQGKGGDSDSAWRIDRINERPDAL